MHKTRPFDWLIVVLSRIMDAARAAVCRFVCLSPLSRTGKMRRTAKIAAVCTSVWLSVGPARAQLENKKA